MNIAHSPTAVFSEVHDAFPELAVHHDRPGTRITSAAAARRNKAVMEKIRQINKQGWTPSTIVNLHSFPLDLNMAYLGHQHVPAKRQGELYTKIVLNQPRLDMVDKGDENFIPEPVFPKEIAEDVVREYGDTGGVFCYDGDGPVPDDLLKTALDAQETWFWALFNEGNANWAQSNKNPRHISDPMRWAAKELFQRGLISDQPEWITITKSESPNVPCEGCGTVIAKVAKFCANCNTVYDWDWVKTRRPDLYLAQRGSATAQAMENLGASGSDAPDIAKMIEDEEATTGSAEFIQPAVATPPAPPAQKPHGNGKSGPK